MTDPPLLPDDLRRELAACLGDEHMSVSEADRLAYAQDLWPLSTLQSRGGAIPRLPDAVVWPGSRDEVRAVVSLARRRRLPLVPFGGGSGVCGAAAPCFGGLVLDLKRLDRVLSIDRESETAVAQCGVNGWHLEEALNRAGYTLGHFPSSIMCSTLGGWIAARSAGQMSTKYGCIEDMVLGLSAVLPDGSTWDSTLAPRSAVGPDLTKLLIGSEGTLGVVTEATLKLHRLPESRRFRAWFLSDVPRALSMMRECLQRGALPAAVRLYDRLDTRMTSVHRAPKTKPDTPGWLGAFIAALGHWLALSDLGEHFALAHPGPVNHAADLLGGPVLLIMVFEGAEDITQAEERICLRVAAGLEARDLGCGPAQRWWEKRYDVSFKMPRVFQLGGWAETLEVATTWSRLNALYRAMKHALSEYAVVMAHFSHAYRSGCNIYFTFAGAGSDAADTERRYHAAVSAALCAARASGATIAHHHGVGVAKARFAFEELGPALCLWRAIKHALDPDDLMNPGKLFPPAPSEPAAEPS